MTQEINKKIDRNILLNPGPATTTSRIKQALIVPDMCPREQAIGELINNINIKLLKVINSNIEHYVSILLSCSGTGALEACLSSCTDINNNKKILILENGFYGQRIAEICHSLDIEYDILSFDHSCPIDIKVEKLDNYLSQNKDNYSVVAFVHHETSTGLLNNISLINNIIKKYNLKSMVDVMSSFGVIDINCNNKDNYIDYLVTSSNKCLHGIAGMGLVIVKRQELDRISGFKLKNYYFNLVKNYHAQYNNKQFLFTAPVQILNALDASLDELFENGGVKARASHYAKLYDYLNYNMLELGFKNYIKPQYHSKILTTFYSNSINYNFLDMHDYLYNKNIIIYPGKLENIDSFRIANMGDLTLDDMKYFIASIGEYLNSLK